MKNNDARSKTRKYSDPLTTQGLAKRAGWNDVIDGKAPDPRYSDHADRLVAMSYEHGRLFACNIKAAGMKPYRWNTTTSTPSSLATQVGRAAALVGTSLPGKL